MRYCNLQLRPATLQQDYGRLDLIGPGNDAPDKDCYPSKTGGKTVNSRIRNDLAISLLAMGKLKINVRLLKTSRLKDTKSGEPCAGGFVRPATFLDYPRIQH